MTLFEKVQQCLTAYRSCKSLYPTITNIWFELKAPESEYDAYIASKDLSNCKSDGYGNFCAKEDSNVTVFVYFEAQPSKEELDELYSDNTDDPDRRYHR